MSVAQEFVDFFVLIEIIRRKYPAGWDQCLHDHAPALGKRVWFDKHLFRDGAMSMEEAQHLVRHWQSLGFETHREVGGKPVEWIDACVSEGLLGATLPCKWIAYDPMTGGAYLAGTTPGKLIGPSRR